MQGEPTKEFKRRIITGDAEGLVKCNPKKRWWRRADDASDGLLIFNKIVYTIDENNETMTITLMNGRIKLWNYTVAFVKEVGVGSTTFELLSGEMQIRIE